MASFENINLEISVNNAQEWLAKMAVETKPKKTSAVMVVKESLKTSDNIEKTKTGFAVWDDYGMDLGFTDNLDDAVEILYRKIFITGY
jgi:hypothetical protein